MSATITITLTPAAQKLLANAQAFPATLLKGIQRALNTELELVVGWIQKRRLSFPRNGPTRPDGLRTVTNRLRLSVNRTDAQINGTTVTASIGSNVKYARYHEYGGTFTVPAHKRRLIAFDRYERRGRGFVQTQSGIRGTIRAHSITFPQRAPFRRGLEDRTPNLSRALSRAVVESFNPPAAIA